MPTKPFHYAFKVDYPEVTNELRTDVLVTTPSFINTTQTKPAVHVIGLWDTGATNTAISSKIVKELNLVPIDKAENYTAAGVHEVNVYYIDVCLPNNVVIKNLKVSECILSDFDVLIGMDIISKGDFCISNGNNKTHFSFCIPPHKNPTCLYEKSEKVNPKVK